MHPKVTPAVIDQYQTVGVAYIPGAVSAKWVADMTAVIDAAIADLRAGKRPYSETPKTGSAEFEDHDGYVRMIKLYRHDAAMRRVVETSDVARIVADVIGSDTMQPWVDGTFMKEGRDPQTATPWHNDECLFPFSGEHSPSMWIALTDVDEDNAPLQTLAGSNRDPHRYLSSWAKEGVEPSQDFHPWSELLDRVNAPDADLRTWPAKAGDMLILHPKTIHASLPRTTQKDGRRLAFSLRWLGSDIRYLPNPAARANAFAEEANLSVGDPIPETLLPMTWRRAEAA